MRTLLTGCALAILCSALSACGSSQRSSSSERTLERAADTYAISQIERSFHEAISKKKIDEMVGLFAPHATGTFGPGKTVTGKQQIRQVWLKSVAFQPETHWLSDHPAYKLKVTVAGDRGTLHFECHFIDVTTGKVAALTAGNLDVARIDGHWLITNFVGSTTELKI
ncbi:MAG TPA: nuclear transport factor 2 family protein [Gaiellaceae bacterium]|nr:nuclear transport factor 2 family protein [Gaiellaceae bacterium]